MFCKYKDFFGSPNTGLHSIRFLNFAIIDIILTVILYYYVEKFIVFTNNTYIKLFSFISIIVFIHRLFCVNTTLNILIFGKV